MRISGVCVAAALMAGVVGPLGAIAPTHAATWLHADPVGDSGGAKRLDVTTVKVRNRDTKVVARVTFAKPAAGDLIVSIDPRGARGLRLVVQRKMNGTVTAEAAPGAFTDRGAAGVIEACTDLKVRWKHEVARLVMPSTCLRDGSFGAIRVAVLTEHDADDSDYAPETNSGGNGASRWIPRG